MCQPKLGAVDEILQTQPRLSTESPKHMHLVTDDGFGRRLVANLLVITVAVATCSANRHLHSLFLDACHDVKDYLMQTASEMAWWSILGLLSSSCCVVQIVLNAFAFGCAGFNSVLGPVRPTFLAMTIVAQASSWYVAYSRPYQWKTTLSMTLMSLFLTLMPEALAWHTARRAGSRHTLQMGAQPQDDGGGGTMHLRVHLSTMGCSSCVATVSKVLRGIQGVLHHHVSIEDGSADIVFDVALTRSCLGSANSNDTMIDLMKKDVAGQLQAAGFPLDDCGPEKTSHAPY